VPSPGKSDSNTFQASKFFAIRLYLSGRPFRIAEIKALSISAIIAHSVSHPSYWNAAAIPIRASIDLSQYLSKYIYPTYFQ
jgi:hypothetical protein